MLENNLSENTPVYSAKRDKKIMALVVSCAGLGFIGGLIGAGVINRQQNDSVSAPAGVNLFDRTPSDFNSSPIVKVVDEASPAVVAISVVKNISQVRSLPFDPFGNGLFGPSPFRIQLREPTGETRPLEVGGGSGFVVDESGLIVTNKHVVSDTSASYDVVFKNGDKLTAKVVARDPLFDIALLKVNKSNLPVINFSDSDKVKVGQSVIAIGNALGEFPNSVSAGIVSGLGRQVQAGDSVTGEVETLNQVIQTDAAINPGNSGGPLLDLTGKAVGVNTAVAGAAENISFAIPANEAARVVNDYKKHGRVVRAVLGVRYVLLNPALKAENNLNSDKGALIIKGVNATEQAVLSGSGAEKAGLKEGDIILKVDGVEVTKEKTLQYFVSNKKPGDILNLTVLSNGQEKNVKVTLSEAE